MLNIKYTLVAAVVFCSSVMLADEPVAEITLRSPGKKSSVTLETLDGKPFWSVTYNGRQVLEKSMLGLNLGKDDFVLPLEAVAAETSTEDTTWTPVWGKTDRIRNHYNQLTWSLKESGPRQRTLTIIARAYDDGVAIRYALDGEGSITVYDDRTHYAFPQDYTCWSVNRWVRGIGTFDTKQFIGPVKLSQYKGYGFPITVELEKDCYAAILEAGIYDFSYLHPRKAGPTTFRSAHSPSTVGLPCKTSWRVVQLAETPGKLIESSILVNLNPPCSYKDTSWIKPGIALWDWRVWGAKDKDGFTYGLDMPSWKRLIDFASKHKIAYLMLDAGWYGLEHSPESNPVTNRKQLLIQPDPNAPELRYVPAPENWEDPIDIEELIQYGKERNVGIILYLNDKIRVHYDMEMTLRTYKEWGAVGIKYGFMPDQGQGQLKKTREIVDLCGKIGLYCNLHDELVPPSGDRRYNPHYLSREFCHSQADGLASFTPSSICIMVFTNMLPGPLDMNNGFLTLTDIEKTRPKVFKVIHSTVVSEAARVLVVFSGLACIPDSPASYESKPDLFEFIAKLPMNWSETRIINGKVGEFITTARKTGNEWFVGSICDEKGVTLPIPLDFLDAGVTYQATIYKDAPDSHYIHNKDSYEVEKRLVKKGDLISARLAPGGGHCIWLKPVAE